tara:strand:+ start:198 stop:464 length:267 start_codon:yes stop_codon:yes gene_type:complete
MKIDNLKDIPASWQVNDDEEVEISFNDLGRDDPWPAIYSRWRAFQNSLTEPEKRVVRRWTCGADEGCSKEEVNDLVKATKGTLDKPSK